MNKDKKTAANKKEKLIQNDKYYKVNADFSYLINYNYKITKEIGRGGYGVVYKVLHSTYAGYRSRQQGFPLCHQNQLQYCFSGAHLCINGISRISKREN